MGSGRKSLTFLTANWTGNCFRGIFIKVPITVNRRHDPLIEPSLGFQKRLISKRVSDTLRIRGVGEAGKIEIYLLFR